MNNCTLFLEGNWSLCCKEHDTDYTEQKLNKWRADLKLALCVFNHVYKAPFKVLFDLLFAMFACVVAVSVALIMWLGVSTVGWYFWLKAKKVVE